MYRLTVLFGHPHDPQAFDDYYESVHLPLARKMTGFTGWTSGKCEALVSGDRPPYYMITGFYASSRAALEAILATPEGQDAVADVPNFATGGAWFIYDQEHVEVPLSLD